MRTIISNLTKSNFLKLLPILAFFIVQSCHKDDPDVLSLGRLDVDLSEIVVNSPTLIATHVHGSPGVDIDGDTLRLMNATTNQELGLLVDDGDLYSHGDEIKGDHVFSGKVTLTETAIGEVQLKAIGKIKNTNGDLQDAESEITKIKVYADIKGTDMKALFDVQDNMVTQLNQHLGGNQNNASSAVAQMLSWLQSQPEVESATMENSTAIEIKYKSGLMGGAVISLEDDNGLVDTRGGFSIAQTSTKTNSNDDRGNSAKVPLAKQTRGKNYRGSNIYSSGKTETFDPNIIGNRNVFIYAPFEASWKNNERSHIINILDSLQCGGGFQVTSYVNQEANVARVSEMINYGVVVLATHGSGGGKAFLTGEIADTNDVAYQTYKPLLQGDNPKMGISINMTISKQGIAIKKADVYKIYAPYISAMSGTFPQSVILNNSCGSDQTPPLRDAFLAKGAKTYYGYTESVNGSFSVTVARDVFTTLAKNKKTTAEVGKIGSADPHAPNAVLNMQGSGTMKFAFELVNGNFEDGFLGWTRSGDGRVISQLGYLDAAQGNYMGIISTGLGYTSETGNISQSFTVPDNATELKVRWNFLSEEFLEYIGSSYQDWFEVVLRSEDFGEEILLSKSVDGIAAEYGASPPSDEFPEGIAGDLLGVSPGIVFDQGGVYMTDWQSETFNISSYKGKCVTLILRSSDVGDSIYDTAILLDDVAVK